ncbi:hypothetical protein F5Y10DRAFT_260805 [Nemania abortiva]|nr:hypothetical protein F5Y10DRAFT_260805 [Nemania abortiva]
MSRRKENSGRSVAVAARNPNLSAGILTGFPFQHGAQTPSLKRNFPNSVRSLQSTIDWLRCALARREDEDENDDDDELPVPPPRRAPVGENLHSLWLVAGGRRRKSGPKMVYAAATRILAAATPMSLLAPAARP